jgi:hypothetical protein
VKKGAEFLWSWTASFEKGESSIESKEEKGSCGSSHQHFLG